MPEESFDIVRCSVVRQYYSTDKDSKTPLPFAEFRAMIFRKEMPSKLVLEIIRAQLWKEVDRMERIFNSINRVKNELPRETGRDYITGETRQEEQLIQARPVRVGGGARVTINGAEMEEVSSDEVLQFFKGLKRRVRYNQIYRYACFYNPNGTIKYQYDENAIGIIESEMAMEELTGEAE